MNFEERVGEESLSSPSFFSFGGLTSLIFSIMKWAVIHGAYFSAMVAMIVLSFKLFEGYTKKLNLLL